ncbi:MAG: tyrosine-type recombinase/integrase [Gemmatimonadota bacterium]
MGLTKRGIQALEYDPAGPAQQIAYDGQIPGFGLRVYPTGRKAFVLRYRTPSGRTRLLTLGKYGVLTLDQARARARKALVEVGDGGDPVAALRGPKPDDVRAFAERYISEHAKPHRPGSWREDRRRLEKHLIPAIGHLRLADVTRTDLAALHARIGARTPVEANRVLQVARAMFSKAIAWGELPEGRANPATLDRHGSRGVKAFKERNRERYVTPKEMPRLMEAIDAEPNIYIKAALRLFLLTGLRRSELLRSEWSDIDLEARRWRVVRKGGDVDSVYLSAPAVEILEQLPRQAGNPHVFPGRSRGSALTSIDKSWRRVRAEAGCEDVTLHDLRRTVGSWMATAGVSLQVIGQVLGHAPGDVAATAIYARLAQDASREALEQHGARLMAVVNGAGA